ncbi:MAG: hypothetical protein M1835_001574 [Candelina submexicana]|nr:MAG: hypothetical protein M1835_001574 [Candelina submexicana]
MPLIVPGINSNPPSSNNNNNNNNNNDKPSDQTLDWQMKLLGKKIGDGGASDNTMFAKNDLPKEHRVIKEGEMVSRDYKPDR